MLTTADAEATATYIPSEAGEGSKNACLKTEEHKPPPHPQRKGRGEAEQERIIEKRQNTKTTVLCLSASDGIITRITSGDERRGEAAGTTNEMSNGEERKR